MNVEWANLWRADRLDEGVVVALASVYGQTRLGRLHLVAFTGLQVLLSLSRADECWALDEAAGAWVELPPLNHARSAFAVFELGGHVVVAGGSQGYDRLSSVEVLDRDEDGVYCWRVVPNAALPVATMMMGYTTMPALA